ncbi:unnamed protein product [Musa textilis]
MHESHIWNTSLLSYPSNCLQAFTYISSNSETYIHLLTDQIVIDDCDGDKLIYFEDNFGDIISSKLILMSLLEETKTVVDGGEGAVDDEVVAADEPGLVAPQVDGGVRYVLRPQHRPLEVGHPAEELLDLFPLHAEELAGQGGGIAEGGDAVDSDAVLAELGRGALRRDVRVRRHPAHHRRHAPIVDDAAPAASRRRRHYPRRVLDPQEHPGEVDVQHPVEVSGVDVRDPGPVAVDDGGVIEHDVEAAVLGDGQVDGAPDVREREGYLLAGESETV